MMKNNFFKLFNIIGLAIIVSSLFISCDANDGVDGINGIDGADGENGIGFNELVQYGSISLTVSGNRPDDATEFTHESVLRFIHNQPGNNNLNPQDFGPGFKAESNLEFYILRFLNSPDAFDASSFGFNLFVNDVGLESEDFELDIFFNRFNLLFDDLKYLEFNNSFYGTDEGVSNVTVSDYSFDETTNNLKFSFTFEIDGESNSTTNDLSISGIVDVLVFEEIELEEELEEG